MEFNLDKVIEKVKTLWEKYKKENREDFEYQDGNMEISCILFNKDNSNDVDVLILCDDDIEYSLDWIKKEFNMLHYGYEYDIDQDLFRELENNMEIGYINIKLHFEAWLRIQDWYPEDVEYKKGMQKYLKYCKENGITKEKIEKELNVTDIPNVMEFYKDKNKYMERSKSMENEEMQGIEQMIEKTMELLKNDEEYERFELSYILIDKDDREEAKAITFYGDEIAEVDLKTNEISPIMDWAYNTDEDVFGELEKNKEIGYMSLDCHYGIWTEIEEYYPEDIEYKKGMQDYLKYCKDNGITKEKLEKEVNYDGEDAMQHYKEKNKAKER